MTTSESIKVLFFAQLKEQLSCDSVYIETTFPVEIAKIKQQLANKDDVWNTIFNQTKLLAAVNHEMVLDDHQVVKGDEVAFFPPVTGG